MSGSIDVVGTSLSVTGDVTVSSGVEVVGTQPFVSLNAVTGNGIGAVADWGSTKGSHTLMTYFTGSPTAWDIALEGSHDGATWVQLGEINSATTGNNPNFKQVAANFRYTRARLVSHTGALTLTASVAAS